MKLPLLCVLLLLVVLTGSVFGRPPAGTTVRVAPRTAQSIDAKQYINANNLLGFVTNFGNLFYDSQQLFKKNDGLYYPYTGVANILNHQNDKTVVFNAGLWMGGKVSGQVRVATAEYSSEYVPGRMIGGTFDHDTLNPAYHVYKIYSDSAASNPNGDYVTWPLTQGAPVDQFGNPLLLGDQTLFTVFNDAHAGGHENSAGSTLPLGIEVRQMLWAQALPESVSTVINLRYDLYNKGANQITGCYVALWSDPDVGQYNNDLVGCDTTAGVFYCYNSGNDNVYGTTAPAVGLQIVQGPIVPATDSSATFFGTKKANYRNLKPTAFVKFIDGTDPWTSAQTYNFMQGLNGNGTAYTYNGTPTKFVHSGNPVTGTGDLDVNPADRRMMLSIGPFNFNPGDSQQVIIRWAVGRGTSPLNSITVLKSYLSAGSVKCCVGTTGNVDAKGIIDLSDLSWLIDYLTIRPPRVLPCPDAANVNGLGIIDLSDLSVLIDYLTIVPHRILPNCP